MVVKYLLNFTPFIQGELSNDLLALVTEIFDFSFIRVANIAKVFQVNVNDEIFGDYLVVVLADVFRTEFHLTSFDIVSTLDERRVKHDSEHCLNTEATVLKFDFDITLED